MAELRQEESKQLLLPVGDFAGERATAETKAFCFFFSKKKALLRFS